jgi:hypothetical protein
MKHKHHIVPKHMGGKNNPENIISLTPEEHAKAHQELYEKYGKIEDYLAWKGLAGFMGKEEIIFNLMSENGKKVGNRMKLEGKGIFDPEKQKTEKYQEGIKLGGKIQGRKMAESGHCKRVAPLGGGKNLGKKSWFNPETGKETQSFECPGEEWERGVNMDRVNVEFLRENSDNVKGTYWISNKETEETRMIFPEDEIPEGFTKGRIFSKVSSMDLHNTSDKFLTEGIPQVSIEFSYIIFNPGNSRWEFIPTVNKERLIKISHTDYYGLVWARDCYLNLMGIKGERSKFQFTANSLDEIQTVLKDWREYFRTLDILSGDKLKKFRRARYEKKLESLKENYNFLEGIRNKMSS